MRVATISGRKRVKRVVCIEDVFHFSLSIYLTYIYPPAAHHAFDAFTHQSTLKSYPHPQPKETIR